jgi:hypothetical protein
MNPIDKDFILRILVIVSALISPFVYINIVGKLPSISSYWETQMQPLFIIVNASTSYFLFSIKRWKISAMLLLFLTAFSVESFITLHNIFAISFFLFNVYPIYLNKKIRWILIPYISSIFFLIDSILYAEIFAITSLCLGHLYLLIRYMLLENKRKSKSYTA